MKLMTRDQFREAVFARDNYRCVVCSKQNCISGHPLGLAQDAHHIIERRLWPDGGYYIDNGASLCDVHHLMAESTELSVEYIRECAGISKPILPPHLYDDQQYDKWGNPILPNGTRLRGDLYDDASVQKVLSNYLSLFTHHVKYPRTYHLPWSPGLTKDDRLMPDTKSFDGRDVIVSLKMDGENTTLYRDYMHARSLAYEAHPSRDRIKALHGSIAHEIPDGWRICGENLYAKHSIHYKDLKAYFMVFSVWDDKNICLSWDDTVTYATLLGLPTVDVVYTGVYNRQIIESAVAPLLATNEGYVVRNASSFHYGHFRFNVAKYVRKGHVHTHGHWMREQIVPNELKK